MRGRGLCDYGKGTENKIRPDDKGDDAFAVERSGLMSTLVYEVFVE